MTVQMLIAWQELRLRAITKPLLPLANLYQLLSEGFADFPSLHDEGSKICRSAQSWFSSGTSRRFAGIWSGSHFTLVVEHAANRTAAKLTSSIGPHLRQFLSVYTLRFLVD